MSLVKNTARIVKELDSDQFRILKIFVSSIKHHEILDNREIISYSKLHKDRTEFGLNKLLRSKLVLKNEKVSGVVVNWMPVSALPRNITCVDPVALESKIVIDASGHDSVAVKRMMDRGYVKWKGMEPMSVTGEDAVVEYTGEVYPGLIATGMSATETHGLPRMGPTFGSMLLSGKKAALVAISKLKKIPNPDIKI